MTQPQMNFSTVQQVVEVLTENGLDGMVQAMAVLLNDAVRGHSS